MKNNITDQNNYTFEGLQNQGNYAGSTDIITLPQDIKKILGEAEKHQTIQIQLCFVCSNYKLITRFKECLTSLHNTKLLVRKTFAHGMFQLVAYFLYCNI